MFAKIHDYGDCHHIHGRAAGCTIVLNPKAYDFHHRDTEFTEYAHSDKPAT